MRYRDFEELFSSKRMQKYLLACNHNTRKAMTLYRYNLKLSQELFTIISCFEVVLRNRIAHHEPICFSGKNAIIDTSYVLNQYARMMKLFGWMGIDGASLVYGLDHVGKMSGKVMLI